jgi:hypothetical protein
MDYLNFKGLSVSDKREPLKQDAQKGRSARPQRVKARGVPLRYVEGLNDATCLREALRRRQGTTLADFFSILQESLVT